MRIVQLMTDQSRYFNPSKNYWFSFNAFLGPGWLNELAKKKKKKRSLDLTAHTSLSPIRRKFAPSFVNYKKGCTRLAVTSDKVYQLLVQGQYQDLSLLNALICKDLFFL